MLHVKRSLVHYRLLLTSVNVYLHSFGFNCTVSYTHAYLSLCVVCLLFYVC